MVNKTKLVNFLLKARTKTYAGAGGKVKPLIKDSYQLEYKEGKWFYRDIYYVGNGIFMGFDAVYFKNKPVLSTSYFGNFKALTEEEADKVLRKALIAKWKTTRLWKKVKWQDRSYRYLCDGNGNLGEFGGDEHIYKKGKEVYHFYYAGGLLVK